MYQAQRLPDTPQGWLAFVAFIAIGVVMRQVLPERFKSGWRYWSVTAIWALAFVAVLIAVHG